MLFRLVQFVAYGFRVLHRSCLSSTVEWRTKYGQICVFVSVLRLLLDGWMKMGKKEYIITKMKFGFFLRFKLNDHISEPKKNHRKTKIKHWHIMFESETQEPVKMCVLIKIMFRKNNCLFCLSMFINSFFFFSQKFCRLYYQSIDIYLCL